MNVLTVGSMDECIRRVLNQELVNYQTHQCALDDLGIVVPDLPSLDVAIISCHSSGDSSTALKWIDEANNQTELENLVILLFAPQGSQQETLDGFLNSGCELVIEQGQAETTIRSQVRCALKIARMQSAITRLNTDLFETSITDSLTRVLNRNGFTLRYDVQWRLSLREAEPIGLIAIDLDHFKQYNDHYGHIEADNCLVKIAQELHETLQGIPHYIGRQGGEEFILLLPSMNGQRVAELAEKIRLGIQEIRIEHKLSPSGGYVTASLGASAAFPADTTMEKLLHATEKALRQAKRNGRNQMCYMEAPKKMANVVYLTKTAPSI